MAAVETLSRFDNPRVATDLLRSWPTMTPRLRAAATEVLFSRPTWVAAFLDAVEKGTVSRADVEPARLELLRHYPDEAVRGRAARVLTLGMARREDVVAEYRKALGLKGDRDRGKAVFKAHCGSCHLVEGVGQHVGADLRAVRTAGSTRSCSTSWTRTARCCRPTSAT